MNEKSGEYIKQIHNRGLGLTKGKQVSIMGSTASSAGEKLMNGKPTKEQLEEFLRQRVEELNLAQEQDKRTWDAAVGNI